MSHIVIVGGGLAAGTAAKTLVDEGFDGDVTVVAEEAHPPYQRPPLSKGYLAGKETLDAVILRPREWYAEHGIDLRTSTRLSTSTRAPTARSGRWNGTAIRLRAPCDRFVASNPAARGRRAAGGGARCGASTTPTTSRRGCGTAGRHLVLIGSGWIGMEVAATARELGNQVTVLERDAVPLALALGTEMGEVFRSLHEEHGVDLRTSVDVQKISGADRADGVVVDGETVPADIVLIGVGAVPNTGLAEQAGLRIGNGILTDSALRTSAPDVYAAGDVASAYHPVIQRHLRSEHWANALHAGPIAARSMLGQPASFADIPYFYTDQFDLGMELSGYAPLMASAELIVRGDVDAREFIAFWIDDGRVVGGMNVNVWKVNKAVQALIRSGDRVDPDRLADPAIPLQSLLEP